MKRLLVILFSVLLLACGKQQEPVVERPLPFTFDENLMQIDSLLQHDADSALTMLLTAQHQTDFDKNYQSLLISEALYKTYNPQLNRYKNETFQETSLHEAIDYFDSLYANYPKNDNLAMLSARSHYMNGVGYYENDSVVDACKEYLKTLEIMEDHFDTEKLTGYKAKFMGLTYSRVGELFSALFMMDSAIDSYEKALSYINRDTLLLYNSAVLEYHLGMQFDEKRNYDSADYYYNAALKHLPDTNTILFRDIMVKKALIAYSSGNSADSIVSRLLTILDQSSEHDEILSRMLAVGYVLYSEELYDSAYIYLIPVFNEGNNVFARLQTAQYLQHIYHIKNDYINMEICERYLSEHALHGYDNQILVTHLNTIYQAFILSHHKLHTGILTNRLFNYIYLLLLIIIFVFTFYTIIKRIRHEEEKRRLMSEIDTVKKENDFIKKEQEKRAFKPIVINSEQYNGFADEPICREILTLANSTNITTRDKFFLHKDCIVNEFMFNQLEDAVIKHYNEVRNFFIFKGLKKKNDLYLCYLYMLGLDDTKIALLKGRDYSTIKKQAVRLQHIIGSDKKLSDFIIDNL